MSPSTTKSILALGALFGVATAQNATNITTTAVPVINGTVIAATSTWSTWNTTVTTAIVVAELTTVCPEPTTLTFNDCEYPVTAGETLVVTNCPCTVTTAIPTITSSLCPPGVVAPVPVPAPTNPPYPGPGSSGEHPGSHPPAEGSNGEEVPPGVAPAPPAEGVPAGTAAGHTPVAPTESPSVPISGADRRAVGGIAALALAALGLVM